MERRGNIINISMEPTINNLYYIILAISMATAAGVLGSFAIMRKMALASDPISHIALPGIGIALLLNIDPILGAAATLVIGALVIWNLEKKTNISTETLIGVIFSVSLAIGSLITPNEDLVDALLGSYATITSADFLISLIISISIIAFLLSQKYKLTLSILSPELAKTSGLNINKLNLYFLMAFVATMLLGIRYLGVLLMGSLIIIPGAVGKNLGTSLNSMITVGTTTAVVSTLLGIFLSRSLNYEPGPSIIIIAALIFSSSLLVKRRQ